MKKAWESLVLAGILSLSLSIFALAGSWQLDTTGYWYQNDDGSYPVNCWQWIDGNQDGIAESYYFNDKGYLLVNTTTPDGYTVDANGAWTVDGIVQTQAIAVSSVSPQPQEQTSQAPTQSSTNVSTTPFDGYTIIVNTNTKKYHYPTCKSVQEIKSKNLGYSDNAAALEAFGYVPCKNCH